MDQQALAKRRSSRRLILVVITCIIALGLYGGFRDQLPSGWPRGVFAGVVFAYLAFGLWLVAKRNKR